MKFNKPSHGWMEVRLGDRLEDISDVPCDSLYGLVKSMLNFITESDYEEVEWSLEPAYSYWVFERVDGVTSFRILNEERLEQFCVKDTKPLIKSLAEGLEILRNLWDYDSETDWSWDFPDSLLRTLRAQLKLN